MPFFMLFFQRYLCIVERMNIKDKIILQALLNAPHAGWNSSALKAAAIELGHGALMVDALFADGMRDATRHVAVVFDTLLQAKLNQTNPDALRIRDRITQAVWWRLEIMTPYREGVCVALAYWARPMRTLYAAKTLWASADAIWIWAGDTATDYNRYTKRALLSGVMASTMLFWLQDRTPQFTATQDFLDRRIDNVLTLGRALSGGKRKTA
jgi:ubiquinone biosynthesis protein COQ9